jgi:hypothetical protein
LQKEKNLLLVAIFAIAMAYLESAVVVYLRGLYGIEDLLRDMNFTPDMYTFIELGREAATIVMLLIIGLIAGSNVSKKSGYFLIAFGVWDIFYYIWLYVFIQWPKSLFEWDILFLIPVPWWGPVIAPILISLLLILTGYFLIKERITKIKSMDWVLVVLSILTILFTFMEDSIGTIVSGSGDLTMVRPTGYNWVLFIASYFLWTIVTYKVYHTNRQNIN